MTSKWITIAFVWLFSLIIVATLAHGQTVTTSPTVLSGSDIGFRLVRRVGDHVVGNFVVRINGQWVEAEPLAKLSGGSH